MSRLFFLKIGWLFTSCLAFALSGSTGGFDYRNLTLRSLSTPALAVQLASPSLFLGLIRPGAAFALIVFIPRGLGLQESLSTRVVVTCSGMSHSPTHLRRHRGRKGFSLRLLRQPHPEWRPSPLLFLQGHGRSQRRPRRACPSRHFISVFRPREQLLPLLTPFQFL